MPDYVLNHVSFSGTVAELKRLLQAIAREDKQYEEEGYRVDSLIDFNRIVPMPQDLNIECGTRTDNGIRRYKQFLSYLESNGRAKDDLSAIPKEWESEFQKQHGIDDTTFMLGKKACQNIQKYGFPTWYEWCVNNWGTKWNAFNQKAVFPKELTEPGAPDEAKTSLELYFKTAWSVAMPVIIALSKQFDQLEIRVEYADENFGYNCGEYLVRDGVVIAENNMEYSEESVAFARNLWVQMKQTHTSCRQENKKEDKMIELTPEMEEQIYRKKLREYRLNDAERHLTFFIFGTEDPEDEDLVEFEVENGFSFESMVTRGSEHYICEKLVDKFEDAFDCNCAENDTWQSVVQEYFKR